MDMFNQPNNPLKINPIVVENDYAIAGWSQGDKGGRALLTNTNNKIQPAFYISLKNL